MYASGDFANLMSSGMINFSKLANLVFISFPRLSFRKSYSSSICFFAISNSVSFLAVIVSFASFVARSILSSLLSSLVMISPETALPTLSDVCLTTCSVAFESDTALSDGFSETPVNPQSPPVSKPSKKSKSAILLFIYRHLLIFYFCVFFSC